MTTTLDEIAARFRSGHARVHAALDGLSPEAANRRPSPEAWSPAEIVEHLNIIARADLPVLERAVAAAPRASGPERLPHGLLGGLFVRFVAPQGRPSKTMRGMKPPPTPGGASALDVAAVLAAFDADTERYLAVTDSARGVDASRVRAASPFVPILRMPLAAFLDGLAGHVHRHADQIERAMRRA
ncbi:MAG TPA: DinB family protein [Rubricoccaceae bacterium]|jgi:hypothetical protein